MHRDTTFSQVTMFKVKSQVMDNCKVRNNDNNTRFLLASFA